MKQSIETLFPVITGIDGLPLDGGKIYIGEYGFDPLAYPKSAFWDEEMTIPAVQPIVTVSGYLTRNGAAARVYVDGGYSMAVHNANDEVVMSDLTVTSLASAYQPLDDALTGISDLSPISSGKMLYTDASGAWAASAITAAGRDVIGAADASAQRAALGLGGMAVKGVASVANAQSGSGDDGMTAALTKEAIDAQGADLIAATTVGVGQTWQDLTASRAAGTIYQNTTGRPIEVAIVNALGLSLFVVGDTSPPSVPVGKGGTSGNWAMDIHAIVPNGNYYRLNSGGTFEYWSELR